ncbi:hypothetical protein JCM3766R1_006399 [Sporobolomyces carnicolor]
MSRPTAQDLHSPARRDRRGSPSYDHYDQPPHARSAHPAGDRDRDRHDRPPVRRWTEDEREQRAIEHEERRGGGRQRLTPERELGYGQPRYPQQEQPYGGYRNANGYNNRGFGGGDDWLDSRRKQREDSGITIWPPSPRTPEPEDKGSKSKHRSSSRRHKSSSSSSRHRSSRHRSKYSDDSGASDASSDSSDADSDDRGARKRSRRHSSSKHRKSASSRHGRKRDLSPLSEGREDDDDKDGARRKRRHSSSAAPSSSKVVRRDDAPAAVDEGDEEWVEKSPEIDLDIGSGDELEVGPLPAGMTSKQAGRNAYGGALRPGEGSAMAAYVSSDQRIPRRGEIGMESEQIERFEQAGYVMSGSRHRRMNAVRVRKENQVISAEEKRGILQLAAQEKVKRENEIVASFRELVDQKLSQK